jgi:hypothetical protein
MVAAGLIWLSLNLALVSLLAICGAIIKEVV